MLFCVLQSSSGNGVKAVSYTHLDVYKRQALSRIDMAVARFKGAEDRGDGTFPVGRLPGSEPDAGDFYAVCQGIACLLYTSRCV